MEEQKNKQNQEKAQQELAFKLQMYEQQINQLKQQMQAIDQAITEISQLNLGLDDLENIKGKEILAQIGRGIYTKAKTTSENLIVDIGDKNFVNKTVPETKNIIQRQVQKLESIKKELENSSEKINQELEKTMNEYQKTQE